MTVLARQVLVLSSSSSRARSKGVMNQTMFDVPDPLNVHVLLLTHAFYVLCMVIFATLIFGIVSVTALFFSCAQNTQMIVPLV